MKTMILVILTAAITNNYVLVKFLGICPFLGSLILSDNIFSLPFKFPQVRWYYIMVRTKMQQNLL